MRPRWFQITNTAARKAEISIRGIIGYPKIYEEYGINAAGTAKDFEKELKALGEVDEIALRIYSPGGLVFDAMAIHDILGSHPARVVAYIDGLAASAATIVTMAADHVSIPSNAYMMIHNAQGIEAGDHRALARMAQDLEKFSADIAKMYAAKIKAVKGSASKKTLTELRSLMDAETWLDGSEAAALGLVDEVTGEVVLSNCIAPLNLPFRVPVNFDRVPANVRAAFDMPDPATPEPTSTEMKIHPGPLLSAAGLGSAAAPAAPTPAAPAPAAAPTASAPTAPAAAAPVEVLPPPAATSTAAVSLDDLRNAIKEGLEPLSQRLTTLEGLRGAGVSAQAWGAQQPVPGVGGQLAGTEPTNEAELEAALKKCTNHTDRMKLINAFKTRAK